MYSIGTQQGRSGSQAVCLVGGLAGGGVRVGGIAGVVCGSEQWVARGAAGRVAHAPRHAGGHPLGGAGQADGAAGGAGGARRRGAALGAAARAGGAARRDAGAAGLWEGQERRGGLGWAGRVPALLASAVAGVNAGLSPPPAEGLCTPTWQLLPSALHTALPCPRQVNTVQPLEEQWPPMHLHRTEAQQGGARHRAA